MPSAVDVVPGLEAHHRLDGFAAVGVGNAHDGRLAHGGMEVEHLLHFARPHFEARGDDHVLGAVDQVEPPRLVHEAHVARPQLPIPERRGGLLRLPPVARNDLRPGNHELADLARKCLQAVVGDHPHVGVEHGHANRDHARLRIHGRDRAVRRHVRGRGRLRQAVHRVNPRAGARVPLVEDAWRRRRATRVDLGERRQVVLAHRLAVEQGDEGGDGRHGERGPMTRRRAGRPPPHRTGRRARAGSPSARPGTRDRSGR